MLLLLLKNLILLFIKKIQIYEVKKLKKIYFIYVLILEAIVVFTN